MTLNRAACERRAYRLATLLTGDPVVAVGLLEAVERSQSDLRVIAESRLDRLTILRSREVTARPLPADALPADAAAAIAGLASQPREAWLLIRAYGLSLREAARSMDCSVTATRVHIELADRRLAASLDGHGVAAAIEALWAYSKSLQVPEHYAVNRERRCRSRRVRTLIGLILLVVLLMAIVDWLSPG